jgi:hypothetical protein
MIEVVPSNRTIKFTMFERQLVKNMIECGRMELVRKKYKLTIIKLEPTHGTVCINDREVKFNIKKALQ